ncbi:hypothetical protein pgond44_11716 [Psychroflexus gondwanensis ACAM 44]|uniref:Uncharacterized protein n=1 Tax=Psychroflexus gondwanensis ACAM 44 TaxID=1189619 RepID=N1WXD9_9FLAO|nr:hypothetical protein pgond44_11716 [Psychroflexus gondwanensis ACAM 44]
MTFRKCHSEGADRRLKNLSLSKTKRFLVEAKKLLYRNDVEIPRRSKKRFSVGMTMVSWWLSDPLFCSGVYRSQVEIDLLTFRTSPIKIPHRGYRLARNEVFV